MGGGLTGVIPVPARQSGRVEYQNGVDVGGVIQLARALLAKSQRDETLGRLPRRARGNDTPLLNHQQQILSLYLLAGRDK